MPVLRHVLRRPRLRPAVHRLAPVDLAVVRRQPIARGLQRDDRPAPAARHEQLELVLDMHTNVSHSRSPTINSWQITYACPPDE